MQIFVSEYLTSGACCDKELPSSLLREGTAMLQAVLEDCACLLNVETVTTLDARIADQFVLPGTCHLVHSVSEEKTLFQKLACHADALFVIAPETGGALAKRKKIAGAAGSNWIGCSADAIQLCTDKLALAKHLQTHNIPTIPTYTFCWEENLQHHFPIVIKPRDGAGSEMTFLIKSQSDCLVAQNAYTNSTDSTEPIWQPYIAGKSISIATIGTKQQHLPITLQQLLNDGRFQYQGGITPFFTGCDAAISNLTQRASASITGFNGYVGFDFILPDNEPENPLIVEINPRLTTSYVGYRALTNENLMERLLFPERLANPICWNDGIVRFNSDGAIIPQSGKAIRTC